MRFVKLAAVLGLVGALGACAQDAGPKQGWGTVIGGGTGALIGSQFGSGAGKLVAVGAGTLIGALIGAEVGKSLDRADQLYVQQASYQGLEYRRSGEPVSWRNPDNGNYGSFTPERTWQEPSGQYCREYQQTVVIGGRSERAYGTACRMPDGTCQVRS